MVIKQGKTSDFIEMTMVFAGRKDGWMEGRKKYSIETSQKIAIILIRIDGVMRLNGVHSRKTTNPVPQIWLLWIIYGNRLAGEWYVCFMCSS